MGISSAPKPTDPSVTAAAQNNSNLYSANVNTVAQSGTVTNPTGTRTTTLKPNTVVDPVTGKENTVYSADVVEALTPEQQKIFNANQSSDYNLAQYGNQQTQQLLERGGSPFSYDTGAHEAWAGSQYDKLNSEANAQNDEALRARLASQGIKLGSEAYNREMANYAKGRDNARNQFMLDAQGQGFQQALATRNQQTNEPLAIATGTQIQMPNFTPGRTGDVATTDMASIYSNYDNARMQAWQAKQSNLGGLFSGVGSLFALSEPSEKKNKEKLPAKTGTGLQLWTFNYKGEKPGTPKRVGVMADEAEKKMPHAVMRGADGKRRVNMGLALGR